MKKETQDKANKLTEQISYLQNHIKAVKSSGNYNNDNKMHLQVHGYGSSSLRNEFLLLDAKEFVDLYIVKVEKKIIELQKEFDLL